MRAKEKGLALIVVLWIAMILILTLYAFFLETAAETSLADGFASRKKAEQLALSGYEKAVSILDADEETSQTLADTWAHDEDEWYEVELGDGVFTLVHPAQTENQMYWGIADEASRLNINRAEKDSLMELPEMTEEIADSIIDWRDENNEPEPSGAEDDYYMTLQPPYSCKDAFFETIEELLFVRGVTAEIFWGEDRNQNGILDPGEDDDGDGELAMGLANLVTVYSVDKNVQEDGSERLHINSPEADLENGLRGDLSPQTIQAIKISGPYPSIGYLFDVQGVTKESFKKIADKVTVIPGEVPGMININTAPEAILKTIPGIEDEMVEALLTYRSQEEVDLSNIGWVLDVTLDEDMKKEQLKMIANHITTRSYQFRIDSVGRIGERLEESLSEEEERPFAFKRILAIYDKLQDPPRPIYFKDISSQGFPYDPWEKPQSP